MTAVKRLRRSRKLLETDGGSAGLGAFSLTSLALDLPANRPSPVLPRPLAMAGGSSLNPDSFAVLLLTRAAGLP